MPTSNNLQQVLGSLDAKMPKRDHRVTISNGMEYARALHYRHGFYVMNPGHFKQVVREALLALQASPLPMNDTNVRIALGTAVMNEINFLRSETMQMRPPVRSGEGPRAAHPGGWADRTGNLAGAFEGFVDGVKV